MILSLALRSSQSNSNYSTLFVPHAPQPNFSRMAHITNSKPRKKNGIALWRLQTPRLRGEKTPLINQQDMAVAHEVVPWLEGLPEGVGPTAVRISLGLSGFKHNCPAEYKIIFPFDMKANS